MLRTIHVTAGRRFGCLILLWLTVFAVLPRSVAQTPPRSADDEAFVRALEQAAPGEPVATRRLAKLLFGVAATLDGGRSSVGLLRESLNLREATRESVMRNADARFARYAGAVDRFKVSVSSLLDRPESMASLFRALATGHEACWRLEGFTRFAETYGAGGADLMTVLSSTQSCSRFRRAAMQPPVVELLAGALEENDELRGEAETLREELAELERLLDDLRRIDEGE